MKHVALTLMCVTAFSVTLQQSHAGVIYREDFESGTASGWSLFSTDGFWHVTENAPASGRFALGYVENETPGPTPNGDYASGPDSLSARNGGTAVSPAILLPSGHVALYFDFLAAVETGAFSFDRLILNGTFGEDSPSGVDFFGQSLASTSPLDGGKYALPVNSGYHRIGIDLSAFAGQLFALDFIFDTFDGIDNGYPGIRIDNIEIDTGPVIPEPSTLVLSSILFGTCWAFRRHFTRGEAGASRRP